MNSYIIIIISVVILSVILYFVVPMLGSGGDEDSAGQTRKPITVASKYNPLPNDLNCGQEPFTISRNKSLVKVEHKNDNDITKSQVLRWKRDQTFELKWSDGLTITLKFQNLNNGVYDNVLLSFVDFGISFNYSRASDANNITI